MKTKCRCLFNAFLLLAVVNAPGATLFEFGSTNRTTAALTLAPKGYASYQQDGFFVVGHSDPRADWPYVHPGPQDGWAGGGEHTFHIVFGVQSTTVSGACRLVLDLLDTHYKSPPHLRIEINGQAFDRDLPVGGDGGAIFGRLANIKPQRVEVVFPAKLLKLGTNTIAIANRQGSWMLYQRVALETPVGVTPAAVPEAGAMIAAARQAASGTKVDQIVVVFKTHFDIGYTDLASNIVQKYRGPMIDQALEVVAQNRDLPPAQQFAWTIPGWPMHKILEDWPEQSTARKTQVEAALKSGHFVVHALPFTTHTESLELEDLVRGLAFSTRITRDYGLDAPRDAKMTDVPEHTRVLATILKQAGVEFMHIGCNGLSTPLEVPPLYWWEGPDGSRILTMYSTQYGTGLNPPKDWPYRTWLALIHTGDNHGPPRPDEVKKVLERAAKTMPGVKVKIGRLSDFADAILAEQPNLPVVRGDATDTWIHGPMSDPIGMKLARNIRPLLAATESLNTLLRGWNVAVPDAAAPVAAAYEQSLLYGEHTWGGSIGWARKQLGFGAIFATNRASGLYARSEASWAEHTSYIERARDLVQPELERNLRALAEAVAMKGPRVVVFNPLPWKRDGVVILPDGRDFLAHAVPALGYRAYDLAKLPPVSPNARKTVTVATPGKAILENEVFQAKLDLTRGVIQSLVHKQTGRELVDTTAEVGFGQFLYERFDQAQVWAYCEAYNREGHKRHIDFDKPGLPSTNEFQYRAAAPRDFRVRFEKTPSSVSAIMEAASGNGVPCGVTTRVVLYHDLPYADLEMTVQNKPEDPWPEAGWLCLPFAVASPQFKLGRPGGITDPARDLIPGGNQDIFTLNTGLTMIDPQGRGVGLCPMDHPLVSLERPGCWKFSRDFIPRKPVVYLNLFNNQWNTNFRLWNGGTWTSRVRLWAVKNGGDQAAALITPSLEARYPLQAMVTAEPAGALPVEQTGGEVSRPGVLVTALGANPDGLGTRLRVWELAGQGGPLRIQLPASLAKAGVQACDLRGRPMNQPVETKAGVLTVQLPAFAPMTFLFKPAAQ
ncbi:MAG: polysaccharide lyase family protein [Verrucomicrobiota bacterium]